MAGTVVMMVKVMVKAEAVEHLHRELFPRLTISNTKDRRSLLRNSYNRMS
jgi:hypothetical protein